MFKISSRAVAAAAVVALVSCATDGPRFKFTHAERRGKLPSNGMRFVLMPDESTQLVEVDVRYDVGAREDPPGKAGIAHLVEHLMFQQRPDGPSSQPLMASINDMSVYFNAYTVWDQTHYQTSARAENIDAMLKIESMRMFYGCQTITEDEFLREREVVRNEIRQRGGTAEGQIPQLILSAIYPKGHAYERMVGGDDSQLTTITLKDACDFMQKYYAPERATLVVAGGFDVDKTVEEIEKWFAKVPKRKPAPRVAVAPLVPHPGKQTFELDVERPSVHISWALPPANTPEGEAVQFGLYSTFFRTAEAAEDYDFATDVSPGIFGGQLAPVFTMSIELRGMGKLGEALEFVEKATKQAYRGFEEGTLEQIEERQNREKAGFIESIEPLSARTEEVAGLVQFSTDFDFDSTEPSYILHRLDKYSKFDGARVASAIKKYVTYDKASIVVIKPNKEGLKGDKRSSVKFEVKSDNHMEPTEVDPREARRPIRMGKELKVFDNAIRFEMGNGMKAVLLPIKSMPVVAAELVFNNVGSALDPDSPALPGAAADFLRLPLDVDALAKTGVRVGCDSGLDVTVCESHGVNIYLDVIIKGLERLVKSGEYDQERAERWAKSVKDQFEQKRVQEKAEYDRQVAAALYGPDHPYTKAAVITPAAAGKVHRDALVAFRDKHYSAGNATIIVTGDFDPKAAERLIRDTFGDWGKGHIDQPISTEPFKRTGPLFIGVVGKEEPQLTVRIEYPAPAGIDGQEGAREVLGEIMNLRVGDVRFKLGSTYGVYAAHRAHKGPGAYAMGGTVDAERAGESLKAMRDGVEMIRNNDHFDEDFVRARRKLIAEKTGVSTVTGELAQRLASLVIYNLPPDHPNTLLQQIAAVSPAQIHALVKNELNPANEAIVVQGDRAHLEKMFADAGIKDFTLIDPDHKK